MPLLWCWLMVTCAWAGLPLARVGYTVDVVGPLAEITVEQTFVNDGHRPIDAVYVFPLHESAAVDGMRIVVGDQVITGSIDDRRIAEVRYAAAVADGHVAALTTEERPNVFTQQVGNIPPFGEIQVSLRVVQPVPHSAGAYELVLPLAVGPRFVSPEAWSRASREPHGRPFLQPAHLADGVPARAHVDVVVDAGMAVRTATSPSHPVAVASHGDGLLGVTADVGLDRDFVLRWAVAPKRPKVAMHVMDGHALLTLEPPAAPPREQIVPRELIWVIDQSGSMSGAPLALVKRAMHRALDHVDSRDSVRVLRFANTVQGDARSRPATPAVIAETRAMIDALEARGGTYLLDGVLAALDTPPDRGRERTVIFLTDGQIGEDRQVLATIADRVGDARLFAFGVGHTPNRWLLDEMARFGGGRTTWLRPGESPVTAVDRFVDGLSRPVLTDLQVDWGDWAVADVWPRRLPALVAGQPLTVVARVVTPGTGPVRLRGRLGDGPYEAVVVPRDAGAGRAVPSTWARQAIANLERDQVWGEVPEVVDRIRTISLEYQVLSQHTAFVAVAPHPTVRRAEEAPVRFDAVEEIEVSAHRRPVDTSSTTRGVVLTKEFLDRIPSGRSYQSAVSVAHGVAGTVDRTPTAMLDGVAITDPVTGTFSLSARAVEQASVVRDGQLPEDPGALGPTIDLQSSSGTNNLEAEVDLWHLEGLGERRFRADGVGMMLSGPIVRDRAWVIGAYDGSTSTRGDRVFEGHRGHLKATVQPNAEHRVSVLGAGDGATTTSGDGRVPQASGLGLAQWQYFASPDVHTDVRVGTQGTTVDGDTRTRQQARADLTVQGVEAAGGHDLKAGLHVDRAAWVLGSPWVRRWLGVPVAPRGGYVLGGGYLQDAWALGKGVELHGGARLDATLGRLHVGPRLYGAWDPFRNAKTKVMAGFARMYSHLGLPTVAIRPDDGLARRDEWLLTLERELFEDIALAVHGVVRVRSGVPTLGGDRIDYTAWGTEVRLEKIPSRRWGGLVSWRHTVAPGVRWARLVDDGSLAGFAHVGNGHVYWDLPTDPWTQQIGVVGTVHADPLGALVPDPTAGTVGNAPRWSVGGRFDQRIDLRKGALHLDLEARHVVYTGSALVPLVQSQVAVPELPGWAGPRVEASVRYAF